MKSFGYGILIIASLIAIRQPALAEDQESLEVLANRLVDVVRIEDMIDQFISNTRSAIVDLARRAAAEGKTETTPEQLADLETMLKEEFEISKQEMMGPMKDLMIRFYMETFSNDELAKLIDIHTSPVFQKQYENMPALTQKSVELGLYFQEKSRARLAKRLEAWKAKYGDDLQ